jgi:hypothetical protein
MIFKVTVAAICTALLLGFCKGSQSRIVSCDRHSSWNPKYLGAYSSLCIHVTESIDYLSQLKRGKSPATFASAAWAWIDDASACIYFVSLGLTKALDDVEVQHLKFYHKIMLRNALIADKEPLVLDNDACRPYIARQESLKKLKVQGMKPHPKLGIKYFDRAASGFGGPLSF